MVDDESQLIEQLRGGDDSAFAPLFESQRDRLRRMVQFRLDPRLFGRIDPEDVVQDIYLAARQRLYAFRADQHPLPLWLRLVGQQTLIDLHRRHLGAGKRSAARERVFAHSHGLSGFVAGTLTSPSQAAIRDELKQQLMVALESMDEIDREVLTLRHFEDLSNKEVAELLSIGENAASNRYVRALTRLKGLLGGFQQP
ncbi:MAG: sigma-70 family RNA polymerase sigma factor [Planctomycetota bacterium]